ncbi:MAG: DEAD/DEAH box helicase, partial [Thermoplasmata archaeon]
MKVSDLGYDQSFLKLVDENDYDLYDHQIRAIEEFRKGKNVLVSVPTASGKTLIAYAAIYETYTKGLKSIYIVPLRSLAMEKYEEMSRLRELGMRVRLSIGNYGDEPDFIKYYDVIVMTSEKADSLLHHDPNMIEDVGLMVVDEIHLMGDDSRGPTLETVITSSKIINSDMKIIALSATVSNATEIAKWLDAGLIVSDFRPVPLQTGILYKDYLYIDEDRERTGSIIDLVKKTVDENGQVIVFVNSRKRSEDFASELSHVFGKINDIQISEDDANVYDGIINEIGSHGVAFHHAGLSNDQRSFIEKNFKNGSIKVIVATPTLAAGVNLPARMVIIKDITRYTSQGMVYLPNLEIKQMIGRAGRPKYDKAGFGIIYAASKNSFEVAKEYIEMDAEPIKSSLGTEKMVRFNTLAVVTMGIGKNKDEIYNFFRNTFYYQQNGESDLKSKIDESIDFLIDNGFIRKGENFSATTFGRYTSDLYIDPESALTLKEYFDKKHSVETALYYISLCNEMFPFNYHEDQYGYEFLEDIGILDGDVDAAKTAS